MMFLTTTKGHTMLFHTDSNDVNDLFAAAQLARVDLTRCDESGSRSRARKFNFLLEGASSRRPNGGTSGAGSGYAALWDQWGLLLAQLFRNDPTAHCPFYESAEHFHWSTGGRFYELTADDMCDHRWEYTGQCVTGSYAVHECKRDNCDAVKRYMLGSKFSDLAAAYR